MNAEYGNALGYSTHARMLKAALDRKGQPFSDDAPIAIHIVTPEFYVPQPNCYNVLYTMYECTTIPPDWVEPVQSPDLLVVPCTQNKVLFGGYTKKPIEVVTEGVDTGIFSWVPRDPGHLEKTTMELRNQRGDVHTREVQIRYLPSGRPFTWLWVGASNPRKGYQQVIFAWKLWRELHPELIPHTLLYLKTTQETSTEHIMGYKNGEPVKQVVPRERVVKVDNARIDTRKVPFSPDGSGMASLQEMYQRAHGYLFPTMGEGFGLTLAEALSTGLPAVYTPWSGPVDFCSHNEAYPCEYDFGKVTTMEIKPDGTKIPHHETCAAYPRIKSVVRQMERIYYGYEEALKKGLRAASRIRAGFTWDISAAMFQEAVERRYREWISQTTKPN